MMDVFFDHFRERNLAALGMNSGSLEGRIGQRPQ